MSDRLSDVVRLLAKRKDGFRTSDPLLEPFGEPSQIGRNMAHLIRNGEIIAVRLTAKSAVFFGCREHADAWMLRTNHTTWETSRSYGSQAELKHRAPLAQGEATLAPDCKVTLCPGYVPRYQGVDVPGAPRVYHGSLGRVQ